MTLTDWLGCWLPKMLIIRFWENWESRRSDISSKAAPIDRYPDIRSKIVWSVVSTQANQKSWSDKHAWQQINRQHSRSSHAVSITSLWKIQSKLSKDLYHPYEHIGEASFVCVESVCTVCKPPRPQSEQNDRSLNESAWSHGVPLTCIRFASTSSYVTIWTQTKTLRCYVCSPYN